MVSLNSASKRTASAGLAVLFLEALFRVNLSKHAWLIALQTGLALLLVCQLAFAARHRCKHSISTNSGEGETRSSGESLAPKSLWQRAASYFQIANPIEFTLATTLFVLLVILTALNVLRQTVDSDEPQHLHTIWGWVRGFVQYRDLSDNHMPLFHILLAPVFAVLGERATIVYWMRLALLPMTFVAAWCTYRIGASLFSRRAGIWAMLGVGLFAGYYRDVTDFTPTALWLPLWLLCLATSVGGSINVRRALVVGLLLGFCFAVSIKSVIFLVSLTVGALLAALLGDRKEIGTSWRVLIARTAAFFLGMVLVPAVIITFFASIGIWREFRYGVLDFNVLATHLYEDRIVYKSHPIVGLLILTMVLPPVFYVGRWIGRSVGCHQTVVRRRLFVLFSCASYFIVMQIFWLPASRTYRPIHPLAFVLATGALLAAASHFPIRSISRRVSEVVPLPAAVALAELLFLLILHPFLKTNEKSESELLRQVLALTTPDDYVLDGKGETIFRRRASPLIMDRITTKAVQRGILVDDAPRRCIETRTCVVSAIAVRSFSQPTRQFIEDNYLPVSKALRVVGTKIATSVDRAANDFNIVIPASYEIISSSGTVSGTLDGVTYSGARFLDPGQHNFESMSTGGELFCVWSRAAERNFAPFAQHGQDKK